MSAKRGRTVSAGPGSDGEHDALLGTIKEGDSCRLACKDIHFLATVEAARRSYAHVQARFKAGAVALADLLIEERVLRDAEDAYATTYTSTATDLATLFKALGGGWNARLSAANASGSTAHKQDAAVQNPGYTGV